VKMFDMMTETNHLQEKLQENIKYFNSEIKQAGFDIKPTQSAIVAVMLYGMVETVHAAGGILQNQHSEKDIIVIVVGIVDFFLLGITALLVAVGLYELFFKPIAGLPDWINIKNMDQLKVMLITVAILVMSISFMGKVVTWNGEDDIMGYGVALGLVIIGLSYFLSIKQQKES